MTPFATTGDLSDADRAYRTKVFDYAMESVAKDQSYTWTSPNASGIITVEDFYISKSKSDCRKYVEVYRVGKEQFDSIGVACRRNGADGWCRIPPGGAQTCALEAPRGAPDTLGKKAGDAVEDAGELVGKAKGALR